MTLRMDRAHTGELADDAVNAVKRGDRVIVESAAGDLYAIVPVSDAVFLEALEDAQDVAAARANAAEDAASGEPPVSLNEARARLEART